MNHAGSSVGIGLFLCNWIGFCSGSGVLEEVGTLFYGVEELFPMDGLQFILISNFAIKV